MHGDPLFSIPLPSEYITDQELKSVQLCFEVHGRSGNHYNLISDKCTSVTALYSAGVVNTEMNVITKIGVRTQGTNGTCHSVKVDLDNCSASMDGAYLNKSSTASVDGVRLSARRSHIRVSVPNCEVSRSLVLWVTCITRHSESLLEVVVSRGDGLIMTRCVYSSRLYLASTTIMLVFVLKRGILFTPTAHIYTLMAPKCLRTVFMLASVQSRFQM